VQSGQNLESQGVGGKIFQTKELGPHRWAIIFSMSYCTVCVIIFVWEEVVKQERREGQWSGWSLHNCRLLARPRLGLRRAGNDNLEWNHPTCFHKDLTVLSAACNLGQEKPLVPVDAILSSC
jgi:hypothetical protein